MLERFSTRFRRITPEHAAAILVSLAPLLYFLPAVQGQLVLCPDDGIIFNLPLRATVAQMLGDGQLPLWNPYVFGGMPLFGAAQAGVLMPLNWLFLFFSPQVAMNLSMLLAYALAALGAYLYARRSGASIAGAATTALVWQWSGFLVAQIGHTNIVQTACLLPWLLWAIDGYGSTGRRSRGVLVAAIVALQVFAGHQQALVYSLVLAGAYAAYMAATQDAGAAARRAYLRALSMLATGLVLAALQILPTLELMRNSVRAGASYEFFSSFSMPPVFLLTFFAPYVVGGSDGQLFRAPYTGAAFYAEYVGYVGLLTLALAACALILGRRDARTKFWTTAALVALALALGRFWPFDLYRLVYYVPVLNLFRVPARHLLEVDFALAVLAGRGVTIIDATRQRSRTTLACVAVGATVFVLTCLTVTAWRPAEFRLGRDAPVTLLRAPELFMPVVVAAASAWALWRFARGRRGASLLLLVVLAFDLCLWGQSSGWRLSSPSRGHALWRTPPVVELLRRSGGTTKGEYRILTTPAPFVADAPAGVAASLPASGRLIVEAQPDTYMMHGVENAAGYDGFGLARYSRLAGNMKLWGELEDAERSLRGESRAFDLLNVRYLVAPSAETRALELPRATEKIGDDSFAPTDIGLPPLEGGARLSFTTPNVLTTRVALVTTLSYSSDVPDGAEVGRLRLRTDIGREFVFPLRAGVDTAEWAHERETARGRIRHRRARVATSTTVEDPAGDYEGHAYVASFELPVKVSVVGGSVEVAQPKDAPKLGLSVLRLSLIEEGSGAAVPVGRQWITGASAQQETGTQAGDTASRWRRVAQAGDVTLYENTHALPRAWLATETQTLADDATLEAIRTGKLADGRTWEPRRTALLDAKLPESYDGGEAAATTTEARVTRYEPNRIDIGTSSPVAAVLVLAENHYPGWRASVDGRAVETLRVDYNLRGVALAPGAHEVRFVYRPKSALAGLLLSALAAVLLLAWWLRWPQERARHLLAGIGARRSKIG